MQWGFFDTLRVALGQPALRLSSGACRGYRGSAPNPCAAALSPQTSLRVRSTEDEDSPKGYRSPKPATLSGGAGRKALFAGAGGQLRVFRQATPAWFPMPGQSVKKVEVQEALLPLNRRGGLLP